MFTASPAADTAARCVCRRGCSERTDKAAWDGMQRPTHPQGTLLFNPLSRLPRLLQGPRSLTERWVSLHPKGIPKRQEMLGANLILHPKSSSEQLQAPKDQLASSNGILGRQTALKGHSNEQAGFGHWEPVAAPLEHCGNGEEFG